MNFDFFGRLQRELRITVATLEETVLAVAEQVQRKVRLLRLHWQAAQIQEQITLVHRGIGQAVAAAIHGTPGRRLTSDSLDETTLTTELARGQEQIRALKAQMLHTDSRIQVLRAEAMRDDLKECLRDLESRGWSLEYVTLRDGMPLVGRYLGDLMATPNLRPLGLLRGPSLLPVDPGLALRADDRLLLMGTPEALSQCRSLLAEGVGPREAASPFTPSTTGFLSHT